MYTEFVQVSVDGRVQTVAHGLRQWLRRHRAGTGAVLLEVDFESTCYEPDEHEFLMTGYEHLPGNARLAGWCYGEHVCLTFNGEVKWCYKGKQGCPLTMQLF